MGGLGRGRKIQNYYLIPKRGQGSGELCHIPEGTTFEVKQVEFTRLCWGNQ